MNVRRTTPKEPPPAIVTSCDPHAVVAYTVVASCTRCGRAPIECQCGGIAEGMLQARPVRRVMYL